MGISPLGIAVYFRRHKIAQLLLEHNAAPNTQDNFEYTPIDYVATAPNPENNILYAKEMQQYKKQYAKQGKKKKTHTTWCTIS